MGRPPFVPRRCADKQDERGNWNIYSDDVDHLGNKINWGRWAITSDDPTFHGVGNPDTGDDYGAAPDLDHLNPDLRAALKDWLTWLMSECRVRLEPSALRAAHGPPFHCSRG